MVIKVYISGISASQEVKKRQQRALLILDSVQVDYQSVDITEPGREEERQWVRQTCKERTNPLPPQFFNDDLYCGDYEDFNSAVDIDKVLKFLKLDSGIDENVVIEKSQIPEQNGKNENDRIENGKEEEKEISFTEAETREEAETEESGAKTEETSQDNEIGVELNESNENNDQEDEAQLEGENSDHVEEELMEEEEEGKEEEDED